MGKVYQNPITLHGTHFDTENRPTLHQSALYIDEIFILPAEDWKGLHEEIGVTHLMPLYTVSSK